MHWFSDVRADLEALGYGVGAADLCAAGAGAPHIRQRLWWVADADGRECDRIATSEGRITDGAQTGRKQGNGGIAGNSQTSGLADAESGKWRLSIWEESQQDIESIGRSEAGRTASIDQPWRNADWLFCRDGKWRPVEPGTFPLAHGLPARMGRLRGYGNAINIQTAQIFIEGYIECSN